MPNDAASEVLDVLSRVTEGRLGPAPQAAGQPAPAAPSPDAQTPKEAAQAAAAPETEGDKQQEDPIAYEISFGENDVRKLSPSQIKGTFERYAALNHKHAEMKPVLDAAQALMESNKLNPSQLVQSLSYVIEAYAKNATMGNKATQPAQPATAGDGAQPKTNEDVAAALKQWEEDNAVSLPPGYRDFATKLDSMTSAQQQTQQMLMALMQQMRGVADASVQVQQGAAQDASLATRRHIQANLNAVQNHLNLPDESVNDFMTFAYERGFTVEDFADGDLLLRVATDFKNNMGSPELERLKAMAARRQAITGSIGSTPSTASPAGQAQDQGDPILQRLIAQNTR